MRYTGVQLYEPLLVHKYLRLNTKYRHSAFESKTLGSFRLLRGEGMLHCSKVVPKLNYSESTFADWLRVYLLRLAS